MEDSINYCINSTLTFAKLVVIRSILCCLIETKLTELSDVVSSYEKLRYQDQLVIQKLKEKLSHIDSAMSPTTQQQLNPLYDEFSSSNQITDLKEQVLKLKGLLKLTWNNKSPQQPVGELAYTSNFEMTSISKSNSLNFRETRQAKMIHLTCR